MTHELICCCSPFFSEGYCKTTWKKKRDKLIIIWRICFLVFQNQKLYEILFQQVAEGTNNCLKYYPYILSERTGKKKIKDKRKRLLKKKKLDSVSDNMKKITPLVMMSPLGNQHISMHCLTNCGGDIHPREMSCPEVLQFWQAEKNVVSQTGMLTIMEQETSNFLAPLYT